MNYIERQVSTSQEEFIKCWPKIATLPTPLQGSVLVPMTERGSGRNSRAAWLLDTDAKIDMVAHVNGLGVFGIAARVFRLKDAFRPYNTITFRWNHALKQGELQAILTRLKAGCLTPSFIVSVQVSEGKGLRHVAVVDTRKLARAVLLRTDRATVREGKGVAFFSIDLRSLPSGVAWSFCEEEVKDDTEGVPVLDLMRAAA